MQYIRGTYSITSPRSQGKLVLFAFIMNYIFFACEVFCIVNPLFFPALLTKVLELEAWVKD
jgi:hypothetical protein